VKTIKLFFIIFLTFLTSFKILNAEETTPFFNNFSGICVNSIHDLEIIKNFSKLENWQPLPENMIPSVAPIDYDNFEGWYFKEGDIAFIVGISDFTENGITKNTCTLASNKANYEINEQLLMELYEVNLIDELKQGIQTSKVFEVKHALFNEVYISTLLDNRKTEFNLGNFGIAATLNSKKKETQKEEEEIKNNDDEIIKNTLGEANDTSWNAELNTSNVAEAFVHGKVTHGDSLRIRILESKTGHCEYGNIAFTVYSYANNPKIYKIKDKIIKISLNDEWLYANLLFSLEFLMGHISFFDFGIYPLDDLYEKWRYLDEIEIEILDSDNFIVSEYFDIPNNIWSTENLKEALDKAKLICEENK
jgi:hypothetical protein